MCQPLGVVSFSYWAKPEVKLRIAIKITIRCLYIFVSTFFKVNEECYRYCNHYVKRLIPVMSAII